MDCCAWWPVMTNLNFDNSWWKAVDSLEMLIKRIFHFVRNKTEKSEVSLWLRRKLWHFYETSMVDSGELHEVKLNYHKAAMRVKWWIAAATKAPQFFHVFRYSFLIEFKIVKLMYQSVGARTIYFPAIFNWCHKNTAKWVWKLEKLWVINLISLPTLEWFFHYFSCSNYASWFVDVGSGRFGKFCSIFTKVNVKGIKYSYIPVTVSSEACQRMIIWNDSTES